MFLEKRVYQGSSGRVYPYPVIDRVSDARREEAHTAVFLENRYLKLMVLPAFGGRIQSAYDKTNNYPFIYHNRVIKPALVGLAGPWLSGGIEFNWPQHHRPGTFCPVDWTTTGAPDGSRTLWLSEIEPMWHLKGSLGLTLHPDAAFLEVRIRLFNPTPLPQSFHLWTNPAVHVNDDYQSVFPPDVHAVYDHGKRDVSAFPVARGTYYRVDYSRGVDISWYRNLPVPTSYMAAKSAYDFIGGYDHGRRAGVLHVADHRFVPGKKQWVWGCGEFGRAWDRNLTDDDGPYAELMCGVFADNQPDFSWLQPYEEKEARQYFLPYKGIGYVRNATVDAAVSLDVRRQRVRLGAYATAERPGARVRLLVAGRVAWSRVVDLSPEAPSVADVRLPTGASAATLRLDVASAEGRTLVAYSPEPKRRDPIPAPARPIPHPARVTGLEGLYLAGLHLEQYRHATREPEDYYREALRREPTDLRCCNALGRLLLRRGRFAEAEPLFRAAIRTQTRHNPNPYDGEPHYNLGLCLRLLGRREEACEAFAKACWSGAWQGAGFFQLAQLTAEGGDLSAALDLADRSLRATASNQKATHLRALLLRRLGRFTEAAEVVEEALARDPLDFGAHAERVHLLRRSRRRSAATEADRRLGTLTRGDPHTHLEIAADYAGSGAYEDALDLLARVADSAPRPAPGHVGVAGLPSSAPMVLYAMGYYASLSGDHAAAARHWRAASLRDPERFFPNGLESLRALEAALAFNPGDATAAYGLGNLWYDKRRYDEAISCWERARRAAPGLPTVHRNLALAYFNKKGDARRARRSLERAFALDPSDGRVLFELDLLRRRTQVPPEARLAFLRRHRPAVEDRDDLLVELATLLNTLGSHDEALRVLTSRRFHPWEGGEGRVTRQYVVSLVELARERLAEDRPDEALALLQRARVYPENLGEGRLFGAAENEVLYWIGLAYERMSHRRSALRFFRESARGPRDLSPEIYYNDRDPAAAFYQGLALERLGRTGAAKRRFTELLRFGRAHLADEPEIDFFAVSLPEFLVFEDDLRRRNQIGCRYLMALGHWGLGRRAEGLRELRRVLRLDPSHQAARLHLRRLGARPRRRVPSRRAFR
jgi:tetratricopeptide (TPR) repeat protein